MDARGAAPRRVVVGTNVFELCELKTLAWRVYAATKHSDTPETAVEPHSQRNGPLTMDAAFAVFADAVMTSPTALTAWQTVEGDTTDPLLWVFSINNAQPLPTEAMAASVHVVHHGECLENKELLALKETKVYLYQALSQWLGKRLLQRGEFRREHQLFCLNEAAFVYRRPSLARVNHFDVFLHEAFATSGLAFHFKLLPSRWLCVNVEMVHQDAAALGISAESSGFATAWMRLMGLPYDRDHSMIDVWHDHDSLAARIVAETKYDDIYPRFRAFPRRHLSRRKGFDGGDDGTGQEDESSTAPGKGGKADANENDRDGDDDNDGANENDDDPRRNGGALGKKKRRKPGSDAAAENDESIIPISPDTHVNSPDAGGPVVGMTFPRERSLRLHSDHEIHVFKRRRRKKTEPTATNGSKASTPASLSFGPLISNSSQPMLLRTRSGSQNALVLPKLETPKTPAASLAVSLVASLTQDDEREALDRKPMKIHPLLQALDDYVEEEMAAHAKRTSSTTAVVANATLVPNAPGFSPSVDEKKKNSHVARLSATRLSYEQLKSQLLSDRFKRYLTGYYPRDFRRNKRQQRRERERRVLIEYDETKVLQYAASAVTSQVDNPKLSVRDQEIAIGISLAALDALVSWRLHGHAKARWSVYESPFQRAADERDTITLVHHVTPHLMELQGVVKEKSDSEVASDEEAGEVHDPWLTLERYCAKTIGCGEDNDDPEYEMHAKPVERLPRLCVSTVESTLHVEVPAISEYTLRGFQPVAAPKPVDYAIVCPHSPAEWLGTLTLSYLSMFRSMYAQSAMGDQAPLELSSVVSTSTVHVDATNATLLVDCATTSDDAFATYRAASELLRPVLAQGIKRKQPFSRSPVANVVYVVAPFGRSDIKHKLWLLGAFRRGLCGEQGMGDGEDDWSKTVTLELLYLDDLINVSVDANPFALLPSAMALYNRIFERVTLKPIGSGNGAAKSRFVCERLYHLAEMPQLPVESTTTSSPSIVHAGFALSSDGKWLLAGFSDALGAVLETCVIAVAGDDLSSALLSFVESALEFVALMGEKTSLAIAQLLPSSSAMTVDAAAWRALADQDSFQQLTQRFELVVTKVVICLAKFLDKEHVHVRPMASSMVQVNKHEGVLVIKPDDAAALQECSRVTNTKWLQSTERASQETAVLRVQLVHTIPLADTDPATTTSRDDLERMLTDWSSLSYLTTHPISLQRQSPLPLHLAAVDELHSELELLAMQLTTDPLALRR